MNLKKDVYHENARDDPCRDQQMSGGNCQFFGYKEITDGYNYSMLRFESQWYFGT